MNRCKPTVLVTGGAGYVGSHSVLLLLEQDVPVVVVDNCLVGGELATGAAKLDANGNVQTNLPESLRRVERLAGKKLVAFYGLDLVDCNSAKQSTDQLGLIFHQHDIKAVIHFAALKSVSESINLPLEYYTNNLVGTINLLNTMKRHGCRRLIFSSSATVYGLPEYLPVDERHRVGQNILNPYGRTKFMIEQMLEDLSNVRAPSSSSSSSPSSGGWKIIALRYFNPVGAHPSGFIGEHSPGVPNNLMPYVSQVSIGKRDKLYVFGDDFDTADGTGVRDYIHIMDLASGHTHALEHLFGERDETGSRAQNGTGAAGANSESGFYKVFNLGTGRGYSVLDVIRTFEETNKCRVPYEVAARRLGDAGAVYADASLAQRELKWRARRSLADMCRDTYKWQTSHPDGFKTS